MAGTPSRFTPRQKAAAIAATFAVVLPAVTLFEAGRDRGAPYRDSFAAGKPWTVCDGKLIDAPRRYSEAECDEQTQREIATNYAPPVIDCVPGLADPRRKAQLSAAILLTWNIGPHQFCRSTAARRFNAGLWRDGCEAFRLFNRANGVVLRGLVNRRAKEVAICLRGLAA